MVADDSMNTGLAVGNDFEEIAGSGICAASDFSTIQEMLEARQQETKAALEALQEELKETAKRRKRRDELGLQIPGTGNKNRTDGGCFAGIKSGGSLFDSTAGSSRKTARCFAGKTGISG